NTHHPPSPLVHPPPLPPPTYFVSLQSGPLTFTPLITCPPLPCHLLSAALTSHCPLSPYVHAVCHVLIFSHPFSPFVTHTHSPLLPTIHPPLVAHPLSSVLCGSTSGRLLNCLASCS